MDKGSAQPTQKQKLPQQPAVKTTAKTVVKIDDVIRALKQVIDPELNLDLWYLGLIYDIGIENDLIKIIMTFTSPFCPLGPEIIRDVKSKVRAIPGVKYVNVDVVFDPPWRPPDELADQLGYW